MGPGVILPFAGGLLSMLASLAAQGRATERGRQEAQSPLGTGNAQPIDWANYGFLPSSMQGQVNEGVQRDPRTLGWLETMRGMNQTGQQNLADMQNSGLFGISGQLGDLYGQMQNEKSATNQKYDQRIAGYDAKSAERQQRVTGLSDQVNANAQRMIDNPDVLSQQEMDQMVGRLMGSSSQRALSSNRMAEADAARRGVSPAQMAAMRENIAQGQRSENLQSVANVLGINAGARERIPLAANAQIGRLEPVIDQIAGIYGGITNQLMGQQSAADTAMNALMPGILTSQAGVQGTAEDRVNAARNAATLDYTGLGDILSGRSAYNTALESGGDAAMSALLSNIGSGLFGLGGSQLQAQAMQQNQPSFWDQMLGGFAGIPSGAASTAGTLGMLKWLAPGVLG